MSHEKPTTEITAAKKVEEIAPFAEPVQNNGDALSDADLQYFHDLANGHVGRFTARIAEKAAEEKGTPGSYFEGGV